MKKKTIALVLACIICVGIGIGGTLAWLTDTTDAVTNTFTTSDIDITLTETGATNNANSYKMVPGYTISKDPKVTVSADSEDCWLFVKLEKSANFDTYMEFVVDSGWTAGTGTAEGQNGVPVGVYFRKITSAEKNTALSVLKDNQVTVKGTVTKALMEAAETSEPTLTVTAYASQLYKNNNATDNQFTAAEAWANAQPTT